MGAVGAGVGYSMTQDLDYDYFRQVLLDNKPGTIRVEPFDADECNYEIADRRRRIFKVSDDMVAHVKHGDINNFMLDDPDWLLNSYRYRMQMQYELTWLLSWRRLLTRNIDFEKDMSPQLKLGNITSKIETLEERLSTRNAQLKAKQQIIVERKSKNKELEEKVSKLRARVQSRGLDASRKHNDMQGRLAKTAKLLEDQQRANKNLQEKWAAHTEKMQHEMQWRHKALKALFEHIAEETPDAVTGALSVLRRHCEPGFIKHLESSLSMEVSK